MSKKVVFSNGKSLEVESMSEQIDFQNNAVSTTFNLNDPKASITNIYKNYLVDGMKTITFSVDNKTVSEWSGFELHDIRHDIDNDGRERTSITIRKRLD